MCSLRRVVPVLVLINDGVLAMRHQKSEKASIGWWTFYLLAKTFFLYHHLAWLKKKTSWNSLCSKDKNSSCSSGHVLRPQLVPHILNRRGESCFAPFSAAQCAMWLFRKTMKKKRLVYSTFPCPRQRNESRKNTASVTPLPECTVLAWLAPRTVTSIAWAHLPTPIFAFCFYLQQFIQIPA